MLLLCFVYIIVGQVLRQVEEEEEFEAPPPPPVKTQAPVSNIARKPPAPAPVIRRNEEYSIPPPPPKVS